MLTQETRKGGEMINQARVAKGLAPLQLVFADMILTADPSSLADADATSFSNKMSSTVVRAFLSNASPARPQQQ